MADKKNKRSIGRFVTAVVVILALAAVATVLLIYRPDLWKSAAPGAQPGPESTSAGSPAREFVLLTWNLRGYPEKDAASRNWFSAELLKLAPDVLCIQEIANQSKVTTFLSTERRFTRFAFVDSPDGQDNAIFGCDTVTIEDLPDPAGFQHPAQTAFLSCRGFDATVVTVHLSWTDVKKREREKALLRGVVSDALKVDPDVIVCGDFNTEQPDIGALADACGLKVMVPGNVATAGTTHAGSRYDWFLVSPDLADEEVIVSEIVTFSSSELPTAKKVSDHLPVRARFRTDEPFRDRK